MTKECRLTGPRTPGTPPLPDHGAYGPPNHKQNQRPWRESIEMEEDLDMATASMMADPFAIHLGGGGSEEGSDEGSDDKLDDEGGANKDGGTEDGGEDEKQDWTKADQLAADEQLQFLAALDGFDDDNSSSFSASLGSGLLGLLGGP